MRRSDYCWSEDDRKRLVDLRKAKTPLAECAKIFGRSEYSIGSQISILIKQGLLGERRWSRQDEVTLENLVGELTDAEIGLRLNRSEESIKERRRKLALNRVRWPNGRQIPELHPSAAKCPQITMAPPTQWEQEILPDGTIVKIRTVTTA
jgi:hypothetical protein